MTRKKVCFHLPRSLQLCSTKQAGTTVFGLVPKHECVALGAIDMDKNRIHKIFINSKNGAGRDSSCPMCDGQEGDRAPCRFLDSYSPEWGQQEPLCKFIIYNQNYVHVRGPLNGENTQINFKICSQIRYLGGGMSDS